MASDVVKSTNPVISFNKAFRYLLIIIPLGVTGNLAFSFWTTDRNILFSVQTFSRKYLALAILLGLIPWLTNTLRLLIWTKFINQPLKPVEAFKIVLANELGSAISPTAVGGGYLKLGMLIQKGFAPGAATSLMTLGSLEDGLFLVVALPIAAMISSSWQLPIFKSVLGKIQEHAIVIVIVIALVITAGFIITMLLRRRKRQNQHHAVSTFSFWRKLAAKSKKLWRDFSAVYILIARRGKGRFALTMTLTAIQWISRLSVISALVASFNLPVDPVRFFLFQWIVFTFMTFTPTPGAMGGAEAAFYFIYSALLPAKLLGIITAAWRFFTFYLWLSLGTVLFGLLQFRGLGIKKWNDVILPSHNPSKPEPIKANFFPP